MFGHTSRLLLSLSLAAMLALGTSFGALAAPEPVSGPDAITATSAASAAQAQAADLRSDPTPDSGEILMPSKYNQTGPENLAPSRYNRTVDRGTGD
jgi:hypothetical protein